jgi:hypothetical protein
MIKETKTLIIEMYSTDYDNLIKRLDNEPSLKKKFINSIKHFQKKHNFDSFILQILPNELDDILLDSLKKLNIAN